MSRSRRRRSKRFNVRPSLVAPLPSRAPILVRLLTNQGGAAQVEVESKV